MKEGIPRRAYALARNNMTVILNGSSGAKNLPPSEPIVRSLTYVRDDKYVILKGSALKNLFR